MSLRDDDRRREESRRILERVDRESDLFFLRSTPRRSQPASGNADWTELWGRRIGRGLAVIAAILLVGWVVSLFINGEI